MKESVSLTEGLGQKSESYANGLWKVYENCFHGLGLEEWNVGVYRLFLRFYACNEG